MVARKKWTITTARQHLPQLVGLAAREPQHVYRRDTLVAAVVSPELAEQVERLARPSLAMKLAELQRLCAEEGYELSTPPRLDRANPFASPRARARPRKPPVRKR
ncbi:MAG TPA: hypothetical protein VGD80_42820 [Kofleriaceae bacterium]